MLIEFFFSFNKYLLGAFYVPDTILGTEDTKVNKTGNPLALMMGGGAGKDGK